jgi:hypothetical protein
MLGFPMTSHPCHACADAESSRASRCREIRGQVPRSIPAGDPRKRERIARRKEAPPRSYPHVAPQTNPTLRHGGGAWIPRPATSSSFASASLCRNVGPAWRSIKFQASGTLSNARRIILTRIQQFRVTFLTLSRAINRSNGDRSSCGCNSAKPVR